MATIRQAGGHSVNDVRKRNSQGFEICPELRKEEAALRQMAAQCADQLRAALDEALVGSE